MNPYLDGSAVSATINRVVWNGGQVIEFNPPIVFTYRPASPSEFSAYVDELVAQAKIADAKGVTTADADSNLAQRRFIAKHMISWNGPFAPDVDGLDKIRPAALARIFNIVVGKEMPDEGGIDLGGEIKN